MPVAPIEDAIAVGPLAVRAARELQDGLSDASVFDNMRDWNIKLGDTIENAYRALAEDGRDEEAAQLMSAFYVQQGVTIAYAVRGAKALGLDDRLREADGSPLRV